MADVFFFPTTDGLNHFLLYVHTLRIVRLQCGSSTDTRRETMSSVLLVKRTPVKRSCQLAHFGIRKKYRKKRD